MEYLYTNLPRYVTVTPRSAFANSVVQEGSILLFSEDGTTRTAKLPDGSFVKVGGTDVSDTTATAADVLAGKDFHLANGSKATGTIQTVTASQSGNIVTVPAGYIAAAQTLTVGTAKAAATYTPTTSDQTITAGQYLTGDQTIKGDANLLAANIVSGVTIFGVTGTASGGSMDFYKCATVDTVNETWTGYKAVFNAATRTYSFEATATSGLTYGSGITPQIGGVYSDGATIAATLYQGDSLNIPGLVFYAPLSETAAYAVTGQAISGSADAYATVQGIPCARFSSLAAYLSASDSALPHGNSAVALSCWLNYSVVPSDFSGILSYGNSQSFGQSIAFSDWNSVLFSGANGVNALTDVTPSTGTWYHFLSVYDGNGTITNYVNGVVAGQPWSSTLNIGNGNIHIAPTEVSRDIYMASVRIYNRVLTPAEIATLAAEFTPSAS